MKKPNGSRWHFALKFGPDDDEICRYEARLDAKVFSPNFRKKNFMKHTPLQLDCQQLQL